MTDEQIMKALEYCTSDEDWIKACKKCPLMGECKIGNGSILDRYALDLIKRQRKEIEVLEETRYELACSIDDLRAERGTIKSEAIKEFAERLKEYGFVDDLSLDGKETVYCEDIDNLVKEITEVEE